MIYDTPWRHYSSKNVYSSMGGVLSYFQASCLKRGKQDETPIEIPVEIDTAALTRKMWNAQECTSWAKSYYYARKAAAGSLTKVTHK